MKRTFKSISFLIFILGTTFLQVGYAADKNNTNLSKLNSWYIKMTEGFSSRNTEPHGSGSKKFKLGDSTAAYIGYNFDSFGSIEGEINLRQNSIQILTDHQFGNPISTTEQSLAFMVNAYLSPFSWRNFTPFIGAGLGYALTQYGVHTNLFPPLSFSHHYLTTKHGAYQFIGGINYALEDNVSMGIEYRYFKIPSLTYLNVHSRYISNDVLLNLTYLFNTPNQRPILENKGMFYFATEGGFSNRQTVPYSTGTKSFQTGPALGLALGYTINYIRLEGEFFFRQNTVDVLQLGVGNHDRPTGDENIFAYMANIYFAPISFYRLEPYIGGGFGYANVTYSVHVTIPPLPGFAHPRLSSSGTAYQEMIGLTYLLTNNFQLGIEYRNFRMNHMQYMQTDGSFINSHINANTGLLRLTYLFGEADSIIKTGGYK